MIKDSIYFNIHDVLKKIQKGDFFFSYEGILFPIFIDYKKVTNKWVVFTPGRHNRSNKSTLPSFQRQSFSQDINANVISLFDPTLMYSSKLALAWFIGDEKSHYAEVAAKLLKSIFVDLNTDFKDILIYGTSGGGIPAVKIGSYLSKATVYVSNIQTDISSYMKNHIQTMVEEVFKTSDIELILNKFQNRINCHEWDGDFNLIVAQNKYDIFHYENHFLPYFKKLEEKNTKLKYRFIEYEDKDSGHGVLDKEIEISIINALIQNEEFIHCLPTCIELKSSKQKTQINNELINRAKKILFEDIFELPYSEPIHFKSLDWLRNSYNNRTWMWHLHQMGYISDLVEYEKYYSDYEAVVHSLKIINSWFDTFKGDLTNEFAWHDHATALRAQNIIKLYLHLKEIGYSTEIVQDLEEMLTLHVKMLLREDFYSRFTNHGLDQSLALYELANILHGLADVQNIKQLAVERINAEISHAFASDGGHVENSPAYLNFGLKQVLEALAIGKAFEGENSKISFPEDILNSAIKALAFITQPDGRLPLIGDTKEFVVRNFFEDFKSEAHENFLYSIRQGKQGRKPLENDLVLEKSGWAIFRETWEKEKFERSTHIVFKCGFLSNYHRHDDDLHFTLFSDNEEWFIDGGEYKHAPKDPYRIYCRSADSHNVSKPYNLRAHRILEDSKDTGIKNYSQVDEISVVEAKSYMFREFENYRQLSYDRSTNTIELHDKCFPLTKESEQIVLQKYEKNYTTYVTKFQIPNTKKVNIDFIKKKVEIIGRSKILTIEVPGFKGNIKLVKAQKEPIIQGWISRKSGILEEAYTLEYYHKTKELDQVYKLIFSNKAKNTTTRNIEVLSSIKDNKVSAIINTNLDQKNLKYAFYLMHDDEKIEVRWYEASNNISFNLDPKQEITRYYVIGFIRDKTGKKYQQKSYPKF